MKKPSAVRAIEITNINSSAAMIPNGVAEMIGNQPTAPVSQPRNKNTMPCSMAMAAPPRILPITIAHRGTGATSTPCKKPSRRSSMIEIVAKIAVNNRIITSVPGKKWA